MHILLAEGPLRTADLISSQIFLAGPPHIACHPINRFSGQALMEDHLRPKALEKVEDPSPDTPVLVGGIPVTPFSSVVEAAQRIVGPDGAVRLGFAVAINAEKVVRSQSDSRLMSSIRNATLCYADGMSVTWTLKMRGYPNSRVPGCELWQKLMREAGRHRIPVFLLGATWDVNRETRKELERRFNTPVVEAQDGFFEDSVSVIELIRSSGAKIVTVAMGSPRQEEFIQRCRRLYPEAFYMGVGGSYDVFVGAVPRAPSWMREVGFEWLYRLARQPTRISRLPILAKYVLLHAFRRL